MRVRGTDRGTDRGRKRNLGGLGRITTLRQDVESSSLCFTKVPYYSPP